MYEELYGDEEAESATEVTPPKQLQELVAPVAEAHGIMGDKSWAFPQQVVVCDQDARPGYNSRKAHEYVDKPEVTSANLGWSNQKILCQFQIWQ